MKLLRRSPIILLLMLLLGTAVQAQDMRDETLFLTYVPNVQFSPVYIALENGYFADQGLNVTIQHGDEPDGVNLIAADQLKFGVISGEQVIQARAQNRPVVFVDEWFQAYPVGVVVPADSGIETVADLAGHKVGIPGLFGASYTGIVALLSSAGMTQDDIQLEPIGYNAPEVMCIGQVDAAVVYVNNEPLQIQQRIDSGDCPALSGISVLPVSDAVDMVSNGIVTNEATIESDPALVQGMVDAFNEGVQVAINNPAEAYLLSTAYVDNLLTDDLKTALEAEAEAQVEFLAMPHDSAEIADSREALRTRLHQQFDAADLVQFDVLLETIRLWESETPGYTDPQSWDLTQNVLVESGVMDSPTDLSGAFTNQFVGG